MACIHGLELLFIRWSPKNCIGIRMILLFRDLVAIPIVVPHAVVSLSVSRILPYFLHASSKLTFFHSRHAHGLTKKRERLCHCYHQHSLLCLVSLCGLRLDAVLREGRIPVVRFLIVDTSLAAITMDNSQCSPTLTKEAASTSSS